MFELVAGMEFGVVAAAGLPHFPEDLEPALAQGSQRAGMGFAAGTKRLVIERCPWRALPSEMSPEMDGGAQGLMAESAQIDFVDLPGLVAHRGGAGQRLESVSIKALAVRADFAKQARGDFGTRSGQRTKEIVIGMLGKELLDLGAVGLNLVVKDAQHPRAGQRQSALGAGEHFARDELARPRENFHAFGIGLRPDKLMAVEELFPFAFPGRGERLRGGEGFDKSPGARQRPVLKGFEGRADTRILAG